jgi:aspartyl-tRNA(Asn)/glutamyl-tRNA(Gln) amidotransferase subunit A
LDWSSAPDAGLTGLRLGIPTSVIADSGATAEMVDAFDAAVATLGELGASVRRIELPLMEHLDGIFNPIMFSEAAAYHEATLRGGGHGRGFRQRALQGFLFTAVEYVQAQRGRRRLIEAMRAVMTDVDIIVTPTVSGGALPVEEYVSAPRSPFTRFFNLTGQPSLSLPCGFDANGMPLGLMVSGRRFDDATVLRVAAAYERSTPWHQRRPPALGDHLDA